MYKLQYVYFNRQSFAETEIKNYSFLLQHATVCLFLITIFLQQFLQQVDFLIVRDIMIKITD